MDKRKCFLIFFGILVCAQIIESTSISLSHRPPKWTKAEKNGAPSRMRSGYNRKSYQAGSSVYMNGGYLTLGAYFTNITVGRPLQIFEVLIDTGSSNVGIPGVNCANCGGSKSPRYDPSKSTSAQAIDCSSSACSVCQPVDLTGTGSSLVTKNSQSDCIFGNPFCYNGISGESLCGYGITYGGGSSAIGGYLLDDIVCFGPYCAKNSITVITDQYAFDGAFNETGDLFTGILGLAYPHNACNPTCIAPLYDVYVSEGLVNNVFGMCLTPTEGGIIDMGFYNSSKYYGDLQWVPVIVEDWYNVALKDIKVGPLSLGCKSTLSFFSHPSVPEFAYVTTNDVIGAFVDSGTSIILISPLAFDAFQWVFQNYYCNLPAVCGQDVTIFNNDGCVPKAKIEDYISEFPSVHFVFDGQDGDVDVSVPPQSYLMDVGDFYCLGIAAVPSVGAVLGDVFMENFYVVFDRQNDRLGFAPIANCLH